MFTDVDYDVECRQLDPGDMLILYTDGVTETQNGEDDYGEERVRQFLQGCSSFGARSLVDACIADLSKFRGQAAATDDITFLAARRSVPN
jgi:sigma-B regulation protein RsbU (phosphoserine phosphatase)